MDCRHCGEPLNDGADACRSCGHYQSTWIGRHIGAVALLVFIGILGGGFFLVTRSLDRSAREGCREVQEQFKDLIGDAKDC